MSLLSPTKLEAALEATWPPASLRHVAGFALRDGGGGGKRVSAATLEERTDNIDPTPAIRAMADAGGPVLFRMRENETGLDSALAAAGYQIIDPTIFYAAPTASLINPAQKPLAAVASELLLGIAAEIWAEGGIGPARLDIMRRVTVPRAYLLARLDARAAGTGFVAVSDGIAMVHALEVPPASRRRGAARAMLHRAAKWALERGAGHVALAVTESNTPARTLYEALGMRAIGQYHYRAAPTGPDT